MINIKAIMIEDDPQMCEILTEYLDSFGILLTTFLLPSDGLKALEDGAFDILLLDLTLPQMDGLEVCKIVKKKYKIPVIITSARGSVADKVAGLELGANDYLPKPFDPRELVARIKANVRNTEPEQRDKVGDFVIDESAMHIQKNGEQLPLTPAEYEVLKLFLHHQNKVLSRDFIVDNVESMKWESGAKSVDVIVGRIRHKIGDETKNPRFIKSIKGFGYRFCI
jgi:two-component system, OmpR family, response regulator